MAETTGRDTSAAAERLPELLEDVLRAISLGDQGNDNVDGRSLSSLITKDLPRALAPLAPGATVRGSVGIGTTAEVPWVGIFAGDDQTSAQLGFYLVYLFAADGSSAFLSLLQGTEHVRGGLTVLRKRAIDLRHAAGNGSGFAEEIDLASPALRPRKYEAATAYAVEYRAGEIPAGEAIASDLARMLQLLHAAIAAGLDLTNDVEPIHLLLKWSTQYAEDTVARHRAVAEEFGSTWWGVMSKRERVLSDSNVASVRQQVEGRGVATYAFLYGNQEVWRARITAITEDADEVDDTQRPAYYTKEGCRLFLRLSHFEQLPASWPTQHLVLASNPSDDPDVLASALGNQTSPLIVYRLLDRDADLDLSLTTSGLEETSSLPELTFEWLEAQTLLDSGFLEELVTALRETSPQVILAGPPGTSKTWVGLALARYLTQDRPLGHRIVQFHASYGYEEFVEGLRPVASSGAISFERVDGVVLQMANDMEDPEEITVLLIDEMNRANLPRVFGELMFLFEYRDQEIDLLYSKDFSTSPSRKSGAISARFGTCSSSWAATGHFS